MQTIYIDISNKSVVPTIYAKQGDVGRKFQVVLTDSGLPYSLDSSSVFSVWYLGASGGGNYTDIGDKSAFSVNGNKVTVEMISQMLVNDGEGILSLVLNESSGNQIGIWNIRYVCESVPGADSEEVKEYYTAFSKSVKELSDVKAILNNKLSVDGSNTMESDLPMGGHRMTGLGDPVVAGDAVNLGSLNTAVKKATPHNLLDNSDFRNPVNQRGLTSLNLNNSYYQYFIDRWCFADWSGNNKGVVSLTADGIACTNGSNSWYQRFEKGHFKTNAKYTFVIYYADNTIEVRPQSGYSNWGINYTESNEFDYFWFFTNDGMIVSKLALYEGEYTDETLPEYQPKGYAAEFVECCRYYLRHTEVWTNGALVRGEGLNVRLISPVQMRTMPTAEIGEVMVYNNDNEWVATTFIVLKHRGGGMYDLCFENPEETTDGDTYLMRGIIALNADL